MDEISPETQSMKMLPFSATVLMLLSGAALTTNAQTTYLGSGDADGTSADGDAFSSVVINNTASTISFTINSTQPMASFIFYSIEIQYAGAGGSGYTGFANPWGPAVGISTGENALINTFGTGASALTYNGGTWTQNASGAYDSGGTGSTSATMTFSLASLGLSLGSSFNFDVVSSYTSQANSGPQAAYGALDNTGFLPESDGQFQPYDGVAHYDSATSSGSTFNTTSFTVQAVPEPGTYALMGLGSLVFARRMRWKKA
jgi:hypothetical protein